ncbi:hypothetical protein K3165_03755 [Qipengyuania sp. 1XM1-15A]|uniref:hypothetical protein n=1 Tax=Qipengyuania xiamenensis TaxID=2867237 RepID=UPI001C877F89|nr:hypothetical protein [Qipengyuania xiamenensis]MBX7532037.1 hypothetical protein [Qipengyuania xiamenensis]
MKKGLDDLAARARDVAEKAIAAKDGKPTSHDALHKAMMAYRAAAVKYIAHPSVGDFVRADAARYEGETRDAVEKIASLIDQLNDLN